MDADLQDMLRISHGVGRDPRLVQGGGGNTSVKTDGGARMYVKASGTALGQMQEGSGYRLVDVAECIAILDDNEIAAMEAEEREAAVLARLVAACRDELPGRPSVETSLHAMLRRCVVHTHPSVINGLLCAAGGREALDGLFADLEPPHLYVPFVGAGYVLAADLRDRLADYEAEHATRPEVIFLENHGLFVTCEDADRALALTDKVFETIEAAAEAGSGETTMRVLERMSSRRRREAVARVAATARRFYAGVFGRPALVRFSDDDMVKNFLELPQAPELCSTAPMTPDQAVYCKAAPVCVERHEEPAELPDAVSAALCAREDGENTPLCLIVDALGLFCAAPTAKLLKSVTDTMKASLETLCVAAHFGGPRPLKDRWIQWMREWEVERFRHELATGEEGSGDLAGRVALVTGAGSGLGRGISLTLARKGTNVVLADINEDAAAETADIIAEAGGGAAGLPLHADVTSEQQVAELFESAVRELGGVDIVVNCAGIAPAHPLSDFPLEDWQRTLDINLTGYFLVAREAARCMIRQGTGGSLINLSSKSGLEPSKHNSAYNATKAGEIHLARGWALDLAEHGIRVNSVCPGNVFEGSNIWNEDYIRAIAAKRGIEPEEVIPHYVGLTALKKEITWEDVGEAVAFLAGSRAAKITGQTLVVDAGQVFVR